MTFGPTQFIETLSPDQNLDISKDSLESVTQEVVCYRVVNLTITGTWNVLLVDTPGFLDTKLSESRITSKITNTLDRLHQSAKSVIVNILYFQPITDIRLGGSKRDAIKILREFAESFEALGIRVLTTMWNHISTTKQIDDANRRISRLGDEIFMSSENLHIDVIKFEFSLDSALSILDGGCFVWHHDVSKSQNMNPQYQSLVLNNLVVRITNAQQQLHNLSEDKRRATTPGKEDPLLLEVVLRDEKVTSASLQSFIEDLQTLLDDMYVKNPQSCSSPFPRKGVNQSSASPPSSKKKVLSARLQAFTSPIKKVFKKL